jgi:hypothetical protein
VWVPRIPVGTFARAWFASLLGYPCAPRPISVAGASIYLLPPVYLFHARARIPEGLALGKIDRLARRVRGSDSVGGWLRNEFVFVQQPAQSVATAEEIKLQQRIARRRLINRRRLGEQRPLIERTVRADVRWSAARRRRPRARGGGGRQSAARSRLAPNGSRPSGRGAPAPSAPAPAL